MFYIQSVSNQTAILIWPLLLVYMYPTGLKFDGCRTCLDKCINFQLQFTQLVINVIVFVLNLPLKSSLWYTELGGSFNHYMVDFG